MTCIDRSTTIVASLKRLIHQPVLFLDVNDQLAPFDFCFFRNIRWFYFCFFSLLTFRSVYLSMCVCVCLSRWNGERLSFLFWLRVSSCRLSTIIDTMVRFTILTLHSIFMLSTGGKERERENGSAREKEKKKSVGVVWRRSRRQRMHLYRSRSSAWVACVIKAKNYFRARTQCRGVEWTYTRRSIKWIDKYIKRRCAEVFMDIRRKEEGVRMICRWEQHAMTILDNKNSFCSRKELVRDARCQTVSSFLCSLRASRDSIAWRKRSIFWCELFAGCPRIKRVSRTVCFLGRDRNKQISVVRWERDREGEEKRKRGPIVFLFTQKHRCHCLMRVYLLLKNILKYIRSGCDPHQRKTSDQFQLRKDLHIDANEN